MIYLSDGCADMIEWNDEFADKNSLVISNVFLKLNVAGAGEVYKNRRGWLVKSVFSFGEMESFG